MEEAGSQNRLVLFKVKNADGLVTTMRRKEEVKSIRVHVAVIDPGCLLFGLEQGSATSQQLNTSFKIYDMRHA